MYAIGCQNSAIQTKARRLPFSKSIMQVHMMIIRYLLIYCWKIWHINHACNAIIFFGEKAYSHQKSQNQCKIFFFFCDSYSVCVQQCARSMQYVCQIRNFYFHLDMLKKLWMRGGVYWRSSDNNRRKDTAHFNSICASQVKFSSWCYITNSRC